MNRAVQAPSVTLVSNHGRPAHVEEVLKKVAPLIESGEYTKALELIGRSKGESPWITNALGVCRLRMGTPATAVEAFRGLVLASGGLILRSDVPTVFKTNYATALLLAGNLEGATDVLRELGEEGGVRVRKLERAIANWKLGLSVWQKLNWFMGATPAKPVELGFLPGDLE